MDFKYKEQERPIEEVQTMAEQMQLMTKPQMHNIIKAQMVYEKFDKEKIDEIAAELCDTDNVNIYLRS